MEWTSEIPQDSGFYWMKYGSPHEEWNATNWFPDVIRVDPSGHVWMRGSECHSGTMDKFLDDRTYLLFAGPIYPPD